MALSAGEKLVKVAISWENIAFIRKWPEVAQSLTVFSKEPATDSRTLLLIQLLDKLVHVQAATFQRQAIRKLCTVQFFSRVECWFSEVDTESFLLAIDAANVLRKYIIKAHELNLMNSLSIFSATHELIMSVIFLSYRIATLSPDLGEAVRNLTTDYYHLDTLIIEITTNDIVSEHVNTGFLETLTKTKPKDYSEYIVWLYTSLKGDFRLGLKNQLILNSERPLVNCKAQVEVVLSKRTMVTPSDTVIEIIDMGFEISQTDYCRFSDYHGGSKPGSLCFLLKGDSSRRIPVLIGKTVPGVKSNFIFVRFTVLKDNQQIFFDSSYYLDWSPVYFEPYARVLLALKCLVFDELSIIKYVIRPSVEYLGRGKIVTPTTNWSHSDSDLNLKQKLCVSSLFQNPVTLIQGPPGTGKSYVCLQMVKSLFDTRDQWDPERKHQVLIISMKNDTLDKMLLAFIEDRRKVVRIGGMSRISELRSQYNVSAIGRNAVPSFRPVVEELAIEKGEISSRILKLQTLLYGFSNGLMPLSVLQPLLCEEHVDYFRQHSIKSWLFEFKEELEYSVHMSRLSEIKKKKKRFTTECHPEFLMLSKVEDDIRREADRIQSSCDLSDLFNQVEILQDLLTLHYCVERLLNEPYNPDSYRTWGSYQGSLGRLDKKERWDLYAFWRNELQDQSEEMMSSEIRYYQDNEKTLQQVFQMASAERIRKKGIEVIGATSCAAAKNRVLIENLSPKLIIIEEAAELLESHIVVSLTKSTTSVILIGDQCQLAPIPASDLSHMKVSLFQRLIDEGLQPLVLDEQFRMRPEISKLVSSLSYPCLSDGQNVKMYPPVHGMKHNLFFWDLSSPDWMTENVSFSNEGEAKRAVQLCSFLVDQGHDPLRITVLTPYNGQASLISSMLARRDNTVTVSCCAVDGFQGDENDIIVLSLVRSNTEGRIGFLTDKRRVTVALSRAKLGLYIIGNSATMKLSKEPSWNMIIEYFEENRLIDSDVSLWCQVHSHGKNLSDCDPGEVFCSYPCRAMLSCGHFCQHNCHGGDKKHVRYKCVSECSRYCRAGHKCTLTCSEPCKCEVKVKKMLSCGHQVLLPCHQPTSQELCHFKTTVNLKCGHTVPVMCRDVGEGKPLPDCFEVCEKVNEKCMHTCIKRCCLDCEPCSEMVMHRLNCGHFSEVPCSVNNFSSVACVAACEKEMPCGHRCTSHCSEPCVCEKTVTKSLCDFGHTVQMLCSDPVKPCKTTCEKTFDECGHRCKQLCSEECLCSEYVPAVLPCGHTCHVPCHVTKNMDEQDEYKVGKWCTNPCGVELPCRHLCDGECSSCIKGILHKKCRATCNQLLTCGHTCSAICSDLVHVCKKPDCLNELPASNNMPAKGKARKVRTLFNITREINSILQDSSKSQSPEKITSKCSLIPKIRRKLIAVVLGPLYGKISRIPRHMIEKNALAQGLISSVKKGIRDLWVSGVPSTKFLKNLIFKMEFGVLLIKYHQDFELGLCPGPALAMNVSVLAQILQTAQSQHYTFSWEQITQLVKLMKRNGPLKFQYTLQYSRPLSDHQEDSNMETWSDWID